MYKRQAAHGSWPAPADGTPNDVTITPPSAVTANVPASPRRTATLVVFMANLLTGLRARDGHVNTRQTLVSRGCADGGAGLIRDSAPAILPSRRGRCPIHTANIQVTALFKPGAEARQRPPTTLPAGPAVARLQLDQGSRQAPHRRSRAGHPTPYWGRVGGTKRRSRHSGGNRDDRRTPSSS